jgi:ABC-type sugar transport system substrate-binding protein
VALLEMRGIAKRFGGVEALKGVDFTLEAREVHALVGENGAGKSTLMKVLSGALIPDSGAILLEGRPLRLHSVAEAQRQGIVMVYQELNLVPDLTVAENLALGRLPPLVSYQRLHAEGRALLAKMGLRIATERPVRSLSAGEQQLVAVARAFAQRAKVMIFDEPTATLAASEAEQLFQLIRRLRDENVGVVYISHRLEEITVDRAASGGKVAYHIASDNVAGGRLAGEFVCKLLGGKGKVAELEGIPGSSAARDRGKGFNDYLKSKCSGVKVVARQTANFDRAQGLTVMENILQAQPALDAVFAHNDEMALGALQAVKASKRPIKVVGFDATDDAVKAVDACEMAATVAQQPKEMGRLSVEKAAELAKGGKAPEKTEFIPVALKLVTNAKCK